MTKEPKIAYEPHPVTPERKRELRASGFTIIDAAYKPADHKAEGAEPITPESIDKMKRKDVVDLLEAHGVEGATGQLPDLRKWLKRTMFAEL